MSFAALNARLSATVISRLGTPAIINGIAQTVLFDDAYAAVQYAGVTLDASRPAIWCITALNPGLKAGIDATVSAVDYIVRKVEPDGQGPSGLTRLELEQVYATEEA